MVFEKKRYLLLKIEREANEPLRQEEFKHCVYEAVFALLGEAGAARANVAAKLFDERKQEGIIRCSLAGLERVIAALACKTSFKGRKIALRLQKISGAIGKLS